MEKEQEKELAEQCWEVWSKSFYNAKRFFESKGNTDTKSRLKDKWCKDFQLDIFNLIKQLKQ